MKVTKSEMELYEKIREVESHKEVVELANNWPKKKKEEETTTQSFPKWKTISEWLHWDCIPWFSFFNFFAFIF